jgi:hypothetical protein
MSEHVAEVNIASALQAQIVGLYFLPDDVRRAVQPLGVAPGDPDPVDVAFGFVVQGVIPVEVSIAGQTHHTRTSALHASLLQLPHVALLYEAIGRLMESRPDLAEVWQEHRTKAAGIIADTKIIAESADEVVAKVEQAMEGGYL